MGSSGCQDPVVFVFLIDDDFKVCTVCLEVCAEVVVQHADVAWLECP